MHNIKEIILLAGEVFLYGMAFGTALAFGFYTIRYILP